MGGDAFRNEYSLDFEGEDEYVSIPDDNSLDVGTGNFTISGWVKLNLGLGTQQVIYYHRNTSGQTAGVYLSVDDGADRVRMLLVGGTSGVTEVVGASDSINGDTWHHIVTTVDRAATQCKLYLDGALHKTDNSIATVGTLTADVDVHIGAISASSNLLRGKIDEVAIWDVALDADAVSAIYNSRKPIALDTNSGKYDNSSDLQGWWRMGDGDTFPIIIDNSNNTNNGTMTNMLAGDIQADVHS